jgi:hypothetical protein
MRDTVLYGGKEFPGLKVLTQYPLLCLVKVCVREDKTLAIQEGGVIKLIIVKNSVPIAQNTQHLYYNDRSMLFRETNTCLFLGSYKIHEYALYAKCTVLKCQRSQYTLL